VSIRLWPCATNESFLQTRDGAEKCAALHTALRASIASMPVARFSKQEPSH
jgi:hypothetical protein